MRQNLLSDGFGHALIVLMQMFGFTGAALSKLRHMQNGGKRGRHSLDQWDRQSTQALSLR